MTSLLKKFRDDLQKPPKGYPLLRGFSQTNRLFPKHSLQPWSASRIHSCELPKLHEHKFVSHPKLRNIFSGNKLTMLFAVVPNSRTNSFQLGGHDTNQSNKQIHQAPHKKVSHLSIQSLAPPNLKKASAEEEAINQNIRSSSFWSFPQDKKSCK